MQVKRVALVPSAFHPSLGGVEELTGQLALELGRRGVSTVICTNRWPRNLPESELWKGIPLHRLPFRMPMGGLRSSLSFALSHKRVLERMISLLRAQNVQVIHVQCVSTNAWYAAQAALVLRVPLVVSMQGERTLDACGVYQRHPIFNRILLRVLSEASHVTGCSRAVLRDASSYSGILSPNRASVLYNGVGDDCFTAGSKWSHPRRYLLAYGRLVPQKGFACLLRAFACAGLKETDLILAGDGPEMSELQRLAQDLQVRERVLFPGRAERPVVAELLRGAHGVVVPSLREPMGIVTLEAMAAGRPLLASGVDGITEVAPAGEDVRHVPPGDVDALKNGLRWLDQRPCGFESLANKKHALNFSWHSVAQQYQSIYAQSVRGLAKGSAGPS